MWIKKQKLQNRHLDLPMLFSRPAYAETHFKFKLPWSLLYRPWPEVIVDAPFQFVPGELPKLWIVMRDADRFPVIVESVTIRLNPKNASNIQSFSRTVDLQANVSEPFAFIPVELGSLPAATYEVFVDITVKRKSPKESRRTYKRWNLPFLKPEPLLIRVLEKELPKAPGYVVGETHCHSYYSADHVEFGATPLVLQQAAKAVGLDFVSVTDHAYDFAFDHVEYTKDAEPLTRFDLLKQEVKTLQKNPLIIAGEEVSAGNSKGENVHVTALGTDNYIPGLGDCGRYWLNNKPTLKISQMLDMTDAPCFAAHPFQQMNALEKFVFRRGYWDRKDLCLDSKNPICGFQFWNGLLDEGFKMGREFWLEELRHGNFILPIAGNDAHGDLNDSTSNALPLFALRHTRDHVFGFARTAVKIDGELTEQNLKAAFLKKSPTYITNGPALWFEQNAGVTTLFAKSNSELGAFRYVKIFGRKRLANNALSQHEELLPESLVAAAENTSVKVNASGFAYVRAECETSSSTGEKRFAMTSAFVV